MPNKAGNLGERRAFARGTSGAPFESSSGNANVTPMPRKTMRRSMCFLVMNTFLRALPVRYITTSVATPAVFLGLPIHLKRLALDDSYKPATRKW